MSVPLRLSGTEDRARKHLEKITPGPWEWDHTTFSGCGSVFTTDMDLYGGDIAVPGGDLYPRGGYNPQADMVFIADAPELVKELLELIEITVMERDAARYQIDRVHDWAQTLPQVDIDEYERVVGQL